MNLSNESAVSGAIATETTNIHVKRKHKSCRHFTPKQHTLTQQTGRWTPRRRLQETLILCFWYSFLLEAE
jgi:hypothetical protein